MNFYEGLFVCTYRYLLKIQNSGKYEISTYFFHATLILVTAIEFMGLVVILSVLNAELVFSMYEGWMGALIILVLLSSNWIYFYKINKYVHLVELYLRNTSEPVDVAWRQFKAIVLSLMLALLFVILC